MMKPAADKRLEVVILMGLLGLCYLMFFHRLGGIGLMGPDEPRYASVAREMWASGDYVTPRLLGEPWFEKPPLMYWGAAAAFGVFGVGEAAARLPSALGATFALFAVYGCARRLYSRGVGFLAALILASSIGFFAFARAASMDMPLTACLTVALCMFLVGYHDRGSARRRWFYGFYAALGLGMLAKGPIAVVLPALSLAAFIALRRRWSEWKEWHPEGIGASLALALPWYAAVTWQNGFEFLNVFIINHNLQRFASTIHGHERPFYYYLPVFLLLTFPWTFLVIPMARRRFGAAEQILACWIIVPFVFFSLAGSKLPGYILPVVPPVAMLFARELMPQQASREYRVAVFMEAAVLIAIGVAALFFGSELKVDDFMRPSLVVVTTFGLAAVLAAFGLWLKPPFLACFNASVVGLSILAAIIFVFPRVDPTETMRPWGAVLHRFVGDEQTVFLYKVPRWMEFGLQYYRDRQALKIDTPQDLVSIASASPAALCIAEDTMMDEITRVSGIDIQVVHTIGRQSAFWIRRVR